MVLKNRITYRVGQNRPLAATKLSCLVAVACVCVNKLPKHVKYK